MSARLVAGWFILPMVQNPIVALAVVAGLLIVLIPMLAGLGLGVRRAVGLRTISADEFLLSVPVGYAIALLVLMLWNLALPVGRSAFALVLLTGVVGLAVNFPALRSLVAGARTVRIASVVAVSATSVWVLAQCLSRFRSWDGALYHVPLVEWAKAYPIVPGLANLQGPFGFHSSSILYGAMIDSLWPDNGFRVANATLVLPALLLTVTAGLRWMRGAASGAPALVYLAVLLPAILHVSWDLASYSTDIPATMLLLTAGLQLQRLVTPASSVPPSAERAYLLLSIGVLVGGAVSAKLSAAPFAGIAMLVGLGWWAKTAPVGTRRTIAIATFVLATAFAAVTTWRSIVLSGYPLFPLAIAGAPVDWKAPAEHVEMEAAYNSHTERAFAWSVLSRNWVHLIFFRDVYAVVIPSALAAIALGLWWRRTGRAGTPGATWRHLGWVLVPSIVAAAVWIGTSPSHRYAVPVFWTAAAACVSAAATGMVSGNAGLPLRTRALLVALALSPLIVEPALGAFHSRSNVFREILFRNGLTREFRVGSGTPPARPTVREFVTNSGLVVTVPVKSRPVLEGMPNACWNARPPCTPTPAANLRLRTPGRIAGGFAVDGAWAMEDWPFYWRAYFVPEWRARQLRASR